MTKRKRRAPAPPLPIEPPRPPVHDDPNGTEISPGEDHDEWDATDEGSWESFPASDPPANSPSPPRPVPPAE